MALVSTPPLPSLSSSCLYQSMDILLSNPKLIQWDPQFKETNDRAVTAKAPFEDHLLVIILYVYLNCSKKKKSVTIKYRGIIYNHNIVMIFCVFPIALIIQQVMGKFQIITSKMWKKKSSLSFCCTSNKFNGTKRRLWW